MNDAWSQGYEAYDEGLEFKDNPHIGHDFDEWNCGYWTAIDDEISYQEFLESEKENDEESTNPH